MQALIRFHKGLWRQPLHVKLWLLLLITVNMIAPLFFLDLLEARVVLAVFLVSFTLMIALTALSGFSRLLGLGHFLWFPLIWFLWFRLDAHVDNDLYAGWLWAVIAFNSTSLAIDVVDVFRYVTGDRGETVAGL